MTLNKILIKYLLAPVMLFMIVQNKSHAGGFPVRPGSLSVSSSVTYFFANQGWDSLRHKAPFPQNGQFTSISYSVFAEYGISKHFSFVASLPYAMNNYHQVGFQQLSSGPTDLETGIKWCVLNINYLYYFGVQATLITPLYTNLNLGYAETGTEIKAAFSGSGTMFGNHYFFNVEDGIRQYYGDQGPVQNRYNATIGLTLDRRLKQSVNLSLGGFYSTSSFKAVSANLALNKNFSFTQASVSYGYAFTRRVSMFVTAGTFVAGRNTGAGSSASISLNIKPFKGI